MEKRRTGKKDREFVERGRREVAGLGETISMLREEKGLHLGDLAKRCRISVAHLSRIEHGERVPSLETLYAIGGALGTSAGALLGRGDLLEGEPQPAREEEPQLAKWGAMLEKDVYGLMMRLWCLAKTSWEHSEKGGRHG